MPVDTLPPPPAGYEDAAPPAAKTKASAAMPPPPDGYEDVPDSAQIGGAIGDFVGGNARVVSDTYKADQAAKPIGPLSPLNYERELIRRQNPNLTETQVSDLARATRQDRRNTPTMRAAPPEADRNIVQKIIAGTGKALSYPAAPVKAALYNLGEMVGNPATLPGDVEEQKKLAAMNFLQKMAELKDQPLRNLGRPETEMYNQKRYQNEPLVGKVMDNAGAILGDLVTNPLTYATGGLGKAAQLGMGGAMVATQAAPLLEDPIGMLQKDPVRAIMDLAMLGLGVHGMREAAKQGQIPAETAPVSNRVKTVEHGKTKGTKVTTPQVSEATGPAVPEQPQNTKPVQPEPAPPASFKQGGRTYTIKTDESGAPVIGKNGKPVYGIEMPAKDAAPTTPAAVAPEAPAVTGVKAEPRASESVPAEPVEPKTTGIAQRVHDVRAEAGKIGEIKPGEGISPEDSVLRGRELIKQGVNPEEHLASMEERGKAVSAEDMAIIRARYEELGKVTDRAYDASRAKPEDANLKQKYLDAKDAETAWAKRIKPYQTEWSNTGKAQQGETDLDTGSFTSIDREFFNRAKRNMNANEEAQATQHAETVKGYETRISDLQKQIDEALKATAEKKAATPAGTRSVRVKSVPSDPVALREHFAKRIADNSLFASKVMKNKEAGAIPKDTMPNFTTSEVRAIWDHAKKNYIDKGTDYHDTVSGVARDLGLKSEWVNHAFTQNKSIRTLTNDMYRVQSYRRNAVANAKAFVESAGKPGYVKVFRAVTNFPRGLAVFGHGAVGMITHAGKNIARPSSWSAYWPNFINQFKFVARPEIHEAAMQTLERSPNFIEKMRAGLKVDPNRIYDDYQLYGKFIGNVGRAGNRGMDALKVFRSEYYDHVMSKLPEELQKDPDMQKAVADWVNGASGSGSIGHGPIADVVHEGMFASSLEASRWKALIGDPVKTAKTFANWKNATPAEQAIAVHRVKTAAEIVAVYLGALGANAGLQQATGQKDKVNFTDPTKTDFMKFKWNGRTLDFTGNALAPVRFLARVVQGAAKSDMREIGGAAAEYARGKLAPQYGIAIDLALRKDAIGRPTPNASAEMKRKAVDSGREPYSWGEYAVSHGPIPLAGAMREVYDTLREKGTDDKTAKAFIAFLTAFPIEATGVRVGHSPKPKAEPAPKGKSLLKGYKGSGSPSRSLSRKVRLKL